MRAALILLVGLACGYALGAYFGVAGMHKQLRTERLRVEFLRSANQIRRDVLILNMLRDGDVSAIEKGVRERIVQSIEFFPDYLPAAAPDGEQLAVQAMQEVLKYNDTHDPDIPIDKNTALTELVRSIADGSAFGKTVSKPLD